MGASPTGSPHARAWRHFRSTPRWWGLALLVVVLLVAFWRLGLWQFENATSNAQQEVAQAAQERPPGELEELLPVGSTFPAPERGRTATTSGSFTGEQFVVPGRRLGGEQGAWVVSRFETDAGASLAVLRGFLPGEPAGAPALTEELTGPVELSGALEAGEEPSTSRGSAEGVHGSVDLAWLANEWPAPIHNGYVFAQEVTAGSEPVEFAPGDLQVVPPPAPESAGWDWQNAGYALQWWLFALFGVWVAVRMLYDESRRAAQGDPETSAGGPPAPAGDPERQG
ncbi:SURF1 family protein [Kytococcus sedentarius]|uniref:SURF1 family protein n=1 Tax=Kytococcus sedentarius TaxID=1276 RepID=UPI0035BC622D